MLLEDLQRKGLTEDPINALKGRNERLTGVIVTKGGISALCDVSLQFAYGSWFPAFFGPMIFTCVSFLFQPLIGITCVPLPSCINPPCLPLSVPVLSSLCCFYIQSRSMSLSLSWTFYLLPGRTLSVVFSFMEINSLLFLHPRMCLLLSPADNTVMTLCDITKEQFSSAFRLHPVKHFFTTTFHYRCNKHLFLTLTEVGK